VKDEAEGQAKRAADALRQWAGDLSDLAAHAEKDSPARSLAAQAGDRGQRAADYLESKGVEGLLSDLQGFARRRPGAFLGGALVAGMAVGRLTKAAKTASQGNGSGGNGSGQGRQQVPVAPAPGEGALTPPAPPPAAPPTVGTPPAGTVGRPFPEA
jgi:hypothetical protein